MQGDMTYASNDDPSIFDYVIASSSLPFLMPAVCIGGDQKKMFLDGGLREVAPLREAIDDGARRTGLCSLSRKAHFHGEIQLPQSAESSRAGERHYRKPDRQQRYCLGRSAGSSVKNCAETRCT
jgi:predicted acylesterase/phospholipase RssA